jgi:hypothetical protein
VPNIITISDLRNLVKEVLSEKKKKQLLESSYSQIMNVVRGQRESIYQLGIMTDQNPRGKPADAKFNNDINKVEL